MNTVRWTFTHLRSGDTWTMPINPNMSNDPDMRPKTLRFGPASPTGRVPPGRRHVSRGHASAPQSVEWEFGGIINTQAHYDQLAAWARRNGIVRVTDHFGIARDVLLRTFEPTERQPTALKPARFTYTMRAQVLKQVSP